MRLYQVKTGYHLKAWRLRGGKRRESKYFQSDFKKKSQLGSCIHPFPIPSSPSNFSLSATVYRNICLHFNEHNPLPISFTFPNERYTHPLNIYVWQEQNAALGGVEITEELYGLYSKKSMCLWSYTHRACFLTEPASSSTGTKGQLVSLL